MNLIKTPKYVICTYLLCRKGQNLQALVQVATKEKHINALHFKTLKSSKQQSGILNGRTSTALLILPLLQMDAKIGEAKIKLTVDTGASLSIVPLSNMNGIKIYPTPVLLTTTNGKSIKCHGQANIDWGLSPLELIDKIFANLDCFRLYRQHTNLQ